MLPRQCWEKVSCGICFLSSGEDLGVVNPFERHAETSSVLIGQLHLEAIFPIDEWIQNHLVLAEVRPALF